MLECEKVYHGFKVRSCELVEELTARCYMLEHEKTGAHLLYVETGDDNKVFSITFRTPPTDNTGVAHILEHSVLCGSRKFKLKEPFVELVKGSMNTFLNAMTFPDKTMYPVASRNEKDFRNLMDVYLDAVFFPQIYDRPDIFKQEGWHYELDATDDDLNYKGVVYNEMKGVFSSPDTRLEQSVMEALFPDTTYGFESGGDPKSIPELSYEDFLRFHKKFYQPANAYLYLYGDMDIEETLAFINAEYLQHFEVSPIQSSIPKQVAETEQIRQAGYPIPSSENAAGKTYFNMSFVVGEGFDAELTLGMQLLNYILLDSPAAPIKKALIAAGIGKEVSGAYAKSLLQPVFSFIVSGAEKDDCEKFRTVVLHELKRLSENGIDLMLKQAALHRLEFSLREANFGSYPKGLIYNIRCMDSWLYDANPLLHLRYMQSLEKIKREVVSGYFERLIETYFLANQHRVTVVLSPEPGLLDAEAAQERAQLSAHKLLLAQEEVAVLMNDSEKLRSEQEKPDSPEALEAIPLLAIGDIKKEIDRYDNRVEAWSNSTVVQTYCDTRGIAYCNLYFDLSQLNKQDVSFVYLLAECLGKIDTCKSSYEELVSRVDLCCGGIDYGIKVYTNHSNHRIFQGKMVVRTKVLAEKISDVTALLQEILLESLFEKEERLYEIVRELKADWQTNLFRRGQQLVSNRVLSYFSAAAQFSEGGALDFYHFLCQIEKKWGQEKQAVVEGLKRISRGVITRENLTLGITLEENKGPLLAAAFNEFIAALPNRAEKSVPDAKMNSDKATRNEGLLMPAQVQYVVKAANYRDLGYRYTGSMKVLETILRYDYFWTKIRVQGGAYGAFVRFNRNGNMIFGSYRDPNLLETLDVYDRTAQYLKTFLLSERDMLKYIIGTMSQMDMPLTAQQKGEQVENWYWRNINDEERQRERNEILATTPEDIRKLAELIQAAMAEDYLCVMGNETAIRDAADRFEKLIDIGLF